MSDRQVPDLSIVASQPRQSLTYEDVKISEEPPGAGGQAVVYEATISGSESPAKVAIKEPHNDQTITTEGIESFLREANTWQISWISRRRTPITLFWLTAGFRWLLTCIKTSAAAQVETTVC